MIRLATFAVTAALMLGCGSSPPPVKVAPRQLPANPNAGKVSWLTEHKNKNGSFWMVDLSGAGTVERMVRLAVGWGYDINATPPPTGRVSNAKRFTAFKIPWYHVTSSAKDPNTCLFEAFGTFAAAMTIAMKEKGSPRAYVATNCGGCKKSICPTERTINLQPANRKLEFDNRPIDRAKLMLKTDGTFKTRTVYIKR